MDYPARFEWQTRCEFNAYCKRTLRNELIDACKNRKRHDCSSLHHLIRLKNPVKSVIRFCLFQCFLAPLHIPFHFLKTLLYTISRNEVMSSIN